MNFSKKLLLGLAFLAMVSVSFIPATFSWYPHKDNANGKKMNYMQDLPVSVKSGSGTISMNTYISDANGDATDETVSAISVSPSQSAAEAAFAEDSNASVSTGPSFRRDPAVRSGQLFKANDDLAAVKGILHVLAPLHRKDRVPAQIVFPADVKQLVSTVQAVHVKMDQLRVAGVFVDDREGRA